MTLNTRLKNKAGVASLAAERAAANRRHAKEYLRKHQLAPAQVELAPSPELRLTVVIPARDERDLTLTLEDLIACDPPGCGVEVIVVLNASEKDPERVRAQNRESRTAIEAIARDGRQSEWLRIFALEFNHLAHKHAGVGVARKLGMDEAVARLLAAEARDGIIVCLDADCRVESNYLRSIATHFDRHADTPACSIHFEHPLSGRLSPEHYLAVTKYELYLRYYRWGLKFCAHPCAHHTVGSCMAVRANTYVRQGGMNRRKGAEDFYFLNKLMLLGGFSEVTDTTVRPSPRESWRVPFGTGRAVGDSVAGSAGSLRVYAPEVFDELAALCRKVKALRAEEAAVTAALPQTLRDYLELQQFSAKLAEIRRHTATDEAFESRFFRWFDGFRALKFVRFASEHRYAKVPVAEAARAMLQRVGNAPDPAIFEMDTGALLAQYRLMDKSGGTIGVNAVPSDADSWTCEARL